MWQTIGTCRHEDIEFADLSHVGLRTDGALALIFSSANEGIVWDVFESRIRRFLPREEGVLDNFLSREGFLNVAYGLGYGKYRIIGEQFNEPLVEHEDLGLGVAVDGPLGSVTLYAIASGSAAVVLPYENAGGDWAVASFCDDGNVLAVLDETTAAFYANSAESS